MIIQHYKTMIYRRTSFPRKSQESISFLKLLLCCCRKTRLIKYSSHTSRDWWVETENYKHRRRNMAGVRLTSYPHSGNLVGNQGNNDRAICYFSNKTVGMRTLQLSWLPADLVLGRSSQRCGRNIDVHYILCRTFRWKLVLNGRVWTNNIVSSHKWLHVSGWQ